MYTIFDIPDEIIINHILPQLYYDDICIFFLTCKRYYKFSKLDNIVMDILRGYDKKYNSLVYYYLDLFRKVKQNKDKFIVRPIVIKYYDVLKYSDQILPN